MITSYLHGDSLLHRIPAAVKLVGLCVATFLLFPIGDPLALAVILAGSLSLYLFVGVRAFAKLKALRMLAFFLLFILAFHVVAGTFASGVAAVLRLLALILLATLVSLTTRMDDMLDVLLVAAKPLDKIGISGRRLALAVAMVIRFTPVLIGLGSRLSEAYRARSGRNGGVRLTAPFALLAMKTADHVSEALTARGGIDGYPARIPAAGEEEV